LEPSKQSLNPQIFTSPLGPTLNSLKGEYVVQMSGEGLEKGSGESGGEGASENLGI